MAYYKCKKCGAEFNNMSLAKYATSINCPECNSLTEYSAADEELWCRKLTSRKTYCY